jgi:glycolate oxidase
MTQKYSRMTEVLIRELKSSIGEKSVSVKDHEIENYSHDESSLIEPCNPDVIVKPLNRNDVAAVLKFAGKHSIAVTPRGAGTGLNGGCVPLYGGIVLSMEKMNRVHEIDTDNFMASVEPGLSLTQLNLDVGQYGLKFPVQIGDMSASIGGAVATNAGGMNAVKYGVTRHHVLGLEAVLSSGEIIQTGGKFVKCSTGYDLTQCIVGSEGTLAVVTGIILKLARILKYKELLFIPFTNLQDAVDAVPEILKLNTIPIGLELIERDIVKLVEKAFGIEVPYKDNEAFLIVITENDSFDDILRFFSQVEDICRRHDAVEFFAPGDESAKKKILEMREKVYPAFQKTGPFAEIDTVVPRSKVAQFIYDVKGIAARMDMSVLASGHAGDGNIHLHPLCVNEPKQEWLKKLPGLMDEIYRLCGSYHGAVSGEHGIGLDKKRFVPMTADRGSLELMKKLKYAFDPDAILNPGKIFDL